MQNTLRLRSTLYQSMLLLLCALMGFSLPGCGETPPQLDTSTATSPVDRPGVCEHCKKKIGKVTEQHLITVRGNQYIVCGDKCEVDLKAWLAKQ